MKEDRKFIVNCCLDEIDACYDRIESGKVTKESQRHLNGWVRRNKQILKVLKYRGKLRRIRKGG